MIRDTVTDNIEGLLQDNCKVSNDQNEELSGATRRYDNKMIRTEQPARPGPIWKSIKPSSTLVLEQKEARNYKKNSKKLSKCTNILKPRLDQLGRDSRETKERCEEEQIKPKTIYN